MATESKADGARHCCEVWNVLSAAVGCVGGGGGSVVCGAARRTAHAADGCCVRNRCLFGVSRAWAVCDMAGGGMTHTCCHTVTVCVGGSRGFGSGGFVRCLFCLWGFAGGVSATAVWGRVFFILSLSFWHSVILSLSLSLSFCLRHSVILCHSVILYLSLSLFLSLCHSVILSLSLSLSLSVSVCVILPLSRRLALSLPLFRWFMLWYLLCVCIV